MLTSGRKNPEQAAALEQVRAWTRARFGLPEEAAVLVTELNCTIPLCPPVETAVAFWTADEKRHQFKLLKPAREVTEDDLAWLIAKLGADDNVVWDCC